MEPVKVSKKLMMRLPIYLNHLKSMPVQTTNVSATTMARELGLGDVQVRKDLAKVSCTGRCRTGRCRKELIQDIEAYLSLTTKTGAIVVGAGRLGLALLDYGVFEQYGLNLMASFDINPISKLSDCGKPIYPMRHLESFCKCYDVQIGIIAVPAENAQQVCNRLVGCGIRAIWNFAPTHLDVPKHVVVQSENLALSLSALRMQIRPM